MAYQYEENVLSKLNEISGKIGKQIEQTRLLTASMHRATDFACRKMDHTYSPKCEPTLTEDYFGEEVLECPRCGEWNGKEAKVCKLCGVLFIKSTNQEE